MRGGTEQPRQQVAVARLLGRAAWPLLGVVIAFAGVALVGGAPGAGDSGAPLAPTAIAGQALVAMVASVAAVPIAVRAAKRRRLIVSDSHKPVNRRVPVGGGVILMAGTAVAACLAFRDARAAAVVLPALIFGLIGFFDDAHNLSRLLRVGSSALLAAPAAWLGAGAAAAGLAALAAPLGWALVVPAAVGFVVGLIIVMFFANSVNLLGGYDGIIPTWTLLSVAALGAATWWHGDRAALPLLALLAASAVAYLWFDRAPSRIFIGNSGTHFIGIYLGAYFVVAGLPLVFLVLFVPNLVEFALYWGFSLLSEERNRVALGRFEPESGRLLPARNRIESLYHVALEWMPIRSERQLASVVAGVAVAWYALVFATLGVP